MSINVTRLKNGLTVATDHMDSVETAAIGMWVGIGARHESADVNGVSHMLEHMAFKGTTSRSAEAIVDEVESVGGQINAYTSRENTAYYLRVLAADVPLAVDILADILQNPTFDPKEIERERSVILQEIAESADIPDDIIFDHFQELAYPDQAIGRPILGTNERIAGMTREMVAGYMQANYGADRMVLAAAGKVDHDKLVRMAEDAFAALPARGPVPEDTPEYKGGDRTFERDLEQVHVVLGYEGVPYGDPDFYAMNALSAVLGGGMSSRLFQEVREKRGLAYSVFSFASAYRNGGLFGVYAGTGQDEAKTLMPVLADEFRKVGEAVTAHEIARVKTQLKAALLMAMEHTRARVERLGQHILIYGRPVPAEEIVAKIEAVDADAIARVAARTFRTKPTLTVMGRAKGALSAPALADAVGAAE